jgi:hypothetical protein
VYPPTQQIIRVGAGDVSKSTKLPDDDPHPEYLADELLVMTEGAEADDGGPSLNETREAGRFGENGWTEAAGMPYYRSTSDRAAERPEKDVKSKRKSRKKGASDKRT